MKRNYAVRGIAVLLGISAAAFEFYPVRELVAALLMFSILFGVVGAGFLVLVAAEELALRSDTWARRVLRHTGRNGASASFR